MGYLVLIAFLITLCFPEMRKRYKKAWRVISHTGVFMKVKITRYLIPLFILTIVITFCSFSCSPPSPGDLTLEEPAQETAEKITVEEPVVEEVTGEPEEEDIEAVEESSEEKEDVTSSTLTGTLKVHFIDVGQGDSILIDLGSEEVLIDGGEKSPGVVDYISKYIDGPLEVMVLTHPHADHIGGLIKVLKDFQVEEIWLNGDTSTSKTYQDFMAAVNAEGAEVNQAKRNGTISTESLNFSILNPPDTLFSDTNNNSIVLRLDYGDTVFLFTGDAENEAEANMLATESELWAQILKVGHHGSSSASSIEFLRKVNPDIAIISCGEGNSYGHPHDITLNNLSNLGIIIYRTDESGDIIVESDGITYRVVEGNPFIYIEEKEQEKEQDLSQEEQPVEEQQLTYGINVVSLTSPISRGSQASITINTAPNVLCTIAVYYKSGKSEAQGLEPKNSDGNGNCTWSWKVGSRTTPGDWKIVLTAEGVGQTETYFTVTE